MFFRGFRALSLGLGFACLMMPGSVQRAAGEQTAMLPSMSMALAPLSLAVGGAAREPMGWTDFCKRYQGECDAKAAVVQKASLQSAPEIGQDIIFDAATRVMIARINSAVNAEVTPATDREMWGHEERWDFPIAGRGDCEDYVLLKRARLMAEGFPRQALLITVVTDLQGDGHAVLTVKTDRGDYILDNMNDEVKLWRETPYGYVKRQAQHDQNAWVSLGAGQSNAIMVSR